MHVECKHGATWKRYDRDIYDSRNYELFGILAGVRGSRIPISYPKGLPIDVSNEVLKYHDSWGEDAHSASWLTFDEIYDSRLDYDNPSLQLIAFEMIMVQRDQQAEDVRIVFWFDS